MATLLQNTSAFHVKIDSNRNIPNRLHAVFGTSSFAIQVLFYKLPSSTRVPAKKKTLADLKRCINILHQFFSTNRTAISVIGLIY